MLKLYLNIMIFFGLVLTATGTYAQHNHLQNNLNSKKTVRVENHIFNEIEEGIMNGDVNKIAKYFSAQPYLSFSNGVNGYYSSNQAYYILEDFFSVYHVVSFSFENKKVEESVSYGTGSYLYDKSGKRESAHLYVTLNKSGGSWLITQISIN